MSEPTSIIEVFGPEPALVEVVGPAEPDVIVVSEGLQGPRGLSAYQVAVVEGFEGSVGEWLESLVGEEGDRGLSAYEVWLEAGGSGSVADFLASLVGEKGKDGDEVSLRTADGFIQWRLGAGAWANLIALEDLKGDDGDDGREVELSTSATHIRWRYDDGAWTDLVALEDITGADGLSAYELAVAGGFEGTSEQWLTSLVGAAGDDGREVALRTTETHVQWQYDGDDIWVDLIALADLKGEDGDDGLEVSLQATATHIQWRLGGGEWVNLVALEDLAGEDGTDGASAYELAVADGFEGTLGEWLESLQGQPGDPGPSAVSTDAGNLLKLGTDDLVMLDPDDLPPGDGGFDPETMPVALGADAVAWGDNSIAVGGAAEAADVGTAVGYGAKAYLGAAAFGPGAQALETRALAVGSTAVARHSGSIAIGEYAETLAARTALIKADSLEIQHSTTGGPTILILTSADGTRWEVSSTDSGGLAVDGEPIGGGGGGLDEAGVVALVEDEESDLRETLDGLYEGGGSPATVQTTVLNGISGTGAVEFAPAFTILSVTYSAGARLRMYRTMAGRISDADRAFTAPYMGGDGLLYDYLALGAETDVENPVDGAWATGESQIYYRVTGPVDVSIRWVQTGAL